jgi:biotin transport system substrate-specific component
MSFGTIAIYLAGCLWLAQFVGWNTVLEVGVLPFLVGDGLKIVCAAIALPSGWTIFNLRQPQAFWPSE